MRDPRYKGKRSWQWNRSDGLLLVPAGLTLVDGVYAGAVTGGVLRSLLQAIAFGCTCFSGAACLATAATLEGGRAARLGAVARVYAVVLVGALAGAVVLPWIAPLLLPDFSATVAPVVLFGVAVMLWPKDSEIEVEAADAVDGTAALPGAKDSTDSEITWPKAFALVLKPKVVLATGAVFSALRAISAFRNGSLHLASQPVSSVELVHASVAVVLAAMMTGAGALLAKRAEAWLQPGALGRAGAMSLVLIGTNLLLGGPMPGYAPLIPLAAVVAIGIIRSLFTNRPPEDPRPKDGVPPRFRRKRKHSATPNMPTRRPSRTAHDRSQRQTTRRGTRRPEHEK